MGGKSLSVSVGERDLRTWVGVQKVVSALVRLETRSSRVGRRERGKR